MRFGSVRHLAAAGVVAGGAAIVVAVGASPGSGSAGPGAVSAFGVATCTPTGGGYCTVPHGLGVMPTAVLATGRSPIGGAGIPAGLVADSYTATTFRVRVLSQTGAPVTTPVTFAWEALARAATPTPTFTPTPTPTAEPTVEPTTPPVEPTTDPPVPGPGDG